MWRNTLVRPCDVSPIQPAPTWGSSATTSLIHVTLLVMLIMIYFVGRWLYSEIQRRHDVEDYAEHERAQIKADTERTARELAALTKILQQFPTVEDRHLHSVRKNRR